jgi:choline dehydrogenase-like flavoprotein
MNAVSEPDQFDVVVIGSGAGGAPLAHSLLLAGKSVLILEKGPLIEPQYRDPRGVSGFKRDELFATGPEKIIRVPNVTNTGKAYYSSHVEPDLNDEPHVYREQLGDDRATIEGYTAQVVGGGTQLYGGVSLRFTPLDFRLGSFNAGRTDILHDPDGSVRREARDWPISYDELEPYYARAERLVGINGTHENQAKPFRSGGTYQPPLSTNPISRFVEVGMDALGMPRYRTPLAVITRDHEPSGRRVPADPEQARTGYVNRYGDPLGLKSSTWVSLLAPLRDRPNFALRYNCVVTRLEAQGSRVNKVWYLDPAGSEHAVTGKVVVVACSAIESVRLLMLSGLADSRFAERINPHGLLGAYFLTHCFGGAHATVPGRYDKSVSLDSDWATDFAGTEAFIREHGLWAGAAIYNNTSDHALPLSLGRTHGNQDLDTVWNGFASDLRLTGEGLLRYLDGTFGRSLSVSFMANQVPLRENRVELHSSVTDKWGRPVAYIVKDWHAHDRYLMDVLARTSADILRYGGDGIGHHPVEGFGGVYNSDNGRARIANHILGGARFGTDPTDSVLDVHCRAWNFDNLYVTDGAFMPTAGGANPTLTIQANSFRVGDHLAERL